MHTQNTLQKKPKQRDVFHSKLSEQQQKQQQWRVRQRAQRCGCHILWPYVCNVCYSLLAFSVPFCMMVYYYYYNAHTNTRTHTHTLFLCWQRRCCCCHTIFLFFFAFVRHISRCAAIKYGTLLSVCACTLKCCYFVRSLVFELKNGSIIVDLTI